MREKAKYRLLGHPFFEKIFMPQSYLDTTFSEAFFKPIIDNYPLSQKQYSCSEFSDIDYFRFGIERCLSQAKSGRDYVQELGDDKVLNITVSHSFKALQSARRLQNITSVNDLLQNSMASAIEDPFASFSELDKWHFYAVDGHYQKAACHDEVHTNSKGKTSKPATGHFCRINLRTHHMSLLDTMLPDASLGRKKEHDARCIKRCEASEHRYGALQGEKVMLVWDKACVDYKAWHTLKFQHGVYFVTMEKSNSAAIACSGDLCDHSDPRNEGILTETLVGVPDGDQMRRIEYKNPQDGKEYTYLTNDLTIPAYLIVTFYKHRWDIEKVYYQFKSKFEERKSWATNRNAKKAQMIFQCLLHNLALLLEKKVEQAGLYDEVEEKLNKGRKREKPVGFINKIVQRASHRTFRFIRWLRNHLNNRASYDHALARLNTLYSQQI